MKYRALLWLIPVLTACPVDPPPTPDFSITLTPPALHLKLEELGSVQVQINRSNSFDGAVTLSLTGDTTKLSTNSVIVNASSNQGTLEITGHDGAKIGTSFLVVSAVSGKLSHTENLALKLDVPIATVNAVTINNNAGSKFVPQGIGNLKLEVMGSSLDRVTAAKLGDSSVTILPGQSATNLAFNLVVGHGAVLGARDLILTTAGGSILERAALTVTAISAAPSGNDTSGSGSSDRPFRSFTRALSAASSGDTVRLANGTYTTLSGEIWASMTKPNVPAGVQILGESPKGVVLDGTSPTFTTLTTCLVFAGDASVSSVTFKNFSQAMLANQGLIRLTDVRSEADGDGLIATGTSQVKLNGSSSEFFGNTRSGIKVAGTATLEVQGGSSHDNTQNGVLVTEKGNVTLIGLEIYANQLGILADTDTQLSLNDLKIHNNLEHGIKALQNSRLALNGVELFANTKRGLWFGGSQLTVRNTVVHDNLDVGALVEGQPTSVDFGNSSQLGNNTFQRNAGNQVLDARADSPNLLDPIFTFSGTSFNATTPNPDVYVGVLSNAPYFSISGKNNTIQVFAAAGVTPSLSINPSSSGVTAGDIPSNFHAVVQNSSGAVNWTLTPTTGAGSISPDRGLTTLYTPPTLTSSPLTAILTATLEGSNLSATSTITIAPNAGRLQVNITGLPPTKAASVLVIGPNGYSIHLSASRLLEDLSPGNYAITAQSIVIAPGVISEPIVGASPVGVLVGQTSSGDVEYSISQTCKPPNCQ